jgi:hypothetical protein
MFNIIAFTAIYLILKCEFLPTNPCGRNRRCWLIPIYNSVNRNSELPLISITSKSSGSIVSALSGQLILVCPALRPIVSGPSPSGNMSLEIYCSFSGRSYLSPSRAIFFLSSECWLLGQCYIGPS